MWVCSRARVGLHMCQKRRMYQEEMNRIMFHGRRTNEEEEVGCCSSSRSTCIFIEVVLLLIVFKGD